MESGNLLSSLFANHSGKFAEKLSSYLEVYWNHFASIRLCEIDILVIGIQNAGSLEIWAKFFPNAKNIIGLENDPKCNDLEFEDPRITVFVDNTASEHAGTLVSAASSNLGVILYDGSNISADVIRSFLIFFPQLRPGGLYVIEDLHASYWSEWQGGISHPDSSIQFLKLVADVVNFDHWGVNSMRTELFDMIPSTHGFLSENTFAEIESVLFLDSVCVIRKKIQNYIGLGPSICSRSHAKALDGLKQNTGRLSPPPSQRENPFANARDLNLTQALTYKTQNQQLSERNASYRESIREMKDTLSWKITKPLRHVRSIFSSVNKPGSKS